MAITYVGGDGAGSSGANTDSLALTLPGGYQAGDVAYIMGFSDEAGTLATMAVTGGTGYTTLIDQGNHSSGRDRVYYLWRKVLTASETNPTITTDVALSHCAQLLVFRGVDNTTPEDATTTEEDDNNIANPDNPAITTANDNAAVVVLLGAVQSASTGTQAQGAPSGYTLASGAGNTGTDADEFMSAAYLLDAGTAGAKTPGVWTNTSDAGADNTMLTLALRQDTGGGAADVFDVGDTPDLEVPSVTASGAGDAAAVVSGSGSPNFPAVTTSGSGTAPTSFFPGTVASDGGTMWMPRAYDPRWIQLFTDAGITPTGNFIDDVKAALEAATGTTGCLDDLWKRFKDINGVTDTSEPFTY